MLLTVRGLNKSYGAISVLQSISFVINPGDRVGLVGSNGAGKSTLLRLLMGLEEADAGSYACAPASETGYLPQSTPDFYGHTIHDLLLEAVGQLRQLEEQMRQLEHAMGGVADKELLPELLEEYGQISARFQDAGGYELNHRIDAILSGLRLDYLPRERDVATLSGGERARLGLAVLLLRAPDLLLLDEPTNHLDFASLAWLETYLAEYPGGILLVSHDRQFLNRTVNRICELDEHTHQFKEYTGNYDAYIEAKAVERRKWEEDYERQQEEIRELRKRVKDAAAHARRNYHTPRDNDKFSKHYFEQSVQRTQARTIKVAEVQLARIEDDPIPRPPEILRVNSHFQGEAIESREVLRLQGVTKSWGERQVLRDVELNLAPRARIVLIGPNGAGKSTLFKLIMGQEQPERGVITVAPGVRLGYLPQEPDDLDPARTVLETYRYGQIGFEGEFVGRLIGYGLFRLEDMHKLVRQLSLGQRRKLEIVCLMAQGPNVLLLDEPTNYISLDVLEAFETAILNFPGPVLAISHDRWFIQRFGGVCWELDQGRLSLREEGSFVSF
ncbi:MAG TPA: ABC-F family ATP-binding cassette domain-containing protein [Ktedonobacteraceae bacterium]|nr:ABC-F family ATP-binding cassette domain-containing protein [Ktedonobacteraceae bacterium]